MFDIKEYENTGVRIVRSIHIPNSVVKKGITLDNGNKWGVYYRNKDGVNMSGGGDAGTNLVEWSNGELELMTNARLAIILNFLRCENKLEEQND